MKKWVHPSMGLSEQERSPCPHHPQAGAASPPPAADRGASENRRLRETMPSAPRRGSTAGLPEEQSLPGREHLTPGFPLGTPRGPAEDGSASSN